jgi:small subunit ribosomal protein S20
MRLSLLISQEFSEMANTKQAAKRAKQSLKHRSSNVKLRTELRTSIKKVQKAIDAGDAKTAEAALRAETSTLDRIAAKGIIHKNKAARHKSRLAQQIKALEGRRA